MDNMLLSFVFLSATWKVGAAVTIQTSAASEVEFIKDDGARVDAVPKGGFWNSLLLGKESELLRRETFSASPKSLTETRKLESRSEMQSGKGPEMHQAGGPPGHWQAVADPAIPDGKLDKMVWVTNQSPVDRDPLSHGQWKWKSKDHYSTPYFDNNFHGLHVENGHWSWMPGARSEMYVRDLRPGPDWPFGHLGTRWHHDHEHIVFHKVDPLNNKETQHLGPPDPQQLKERQEHLQIDLAKQKLQDTELDKEHPLPEKIHVPFNPYMSQDIAQKNYEYDVGQNGALGTWHNLNIAGTQQSNKHHHQSKSKGKVHGKPLDLYNGSPLPPGWNHDHGNVPQRLQHHQGEHGHDHDWEFHQSHGYNGKGYYDRVHYGVQTQTDVPVILPPEQHWTYEGNYGEPPTSQGHFEEQFHNPWGHRSYAASFPETESVDDSESVQELSSDSSSVLPSLR